MQDTSRPRMVGCHLMVSSSDQAKLEQAYSAGTGLSRCQGGVKEVMTKRFYSAQAPGGRLVGASCQGIIDHAYPNADGGARAVLGVRRCRLCPKRNGSR